MKHIIYSFLFFAFQMGFSQTQSGSIEYLLVYQQNYKDHLNAEIEKVSQYKAMLLNYRDIILSLDKQISFTSLFCDGKNYFSKNPFIIEESKRSETKNILIKSKNDGIYYSNTQTDKLLKFENVYDKDYVISLPTPKWEIFDTEIIIMGYSCYKATTKRLGSNGKDFDTVTAWFAPALNIPVAPNGFIGLPGAVLKLDLRLYSLVATGIVFEDCALPDIKIPKKIWTLDAFLKEVNEINRRLRN